MEIYPISFSTSAFLISESSSALRRLFLAFLSLDYFGIWGQQARRKLGVQGGHFSRLI